MFEYEYNSKFHTKDQARQGNHPGEAGGENRGNQADNNCPGEGKLHSFGITGTKNLKILQNKNRRSF